MPVGIYVRKLKPISQRLMEKITKDARTGCWVWGGSASIFGHGQIARGGYGKNGKKLLTAHRVSWELHCGPIPAGLFVLHKCDNPPCCNPSHLFLGTKADNIHDAMSKDRHAREFDLPHTKLSDREVRTIRTSKLEVRHLAKRYGVSRSLISMIRTGKRRTLA